MSNVRFTIHRENVVETHVWTSRRSWEEGTDVDGEEADNEDI